MIERSESMSGAGEAGANLSDLLGATIEGFAVSDVDDEMMEIGMAHVAERLHRSETQLAEAMKVLRQIADMKRKTREQRIASAFVRFVDALDNVST